MGKDWKTASVAAAILGLAAVPAHAALYTATVTGTIDTGSVYDEGDPNVISLSGLPYSIIYTIDTTRGYLTNTPTYEQVYGYQGLGLYTTVPVTAVVKISGYSNFSFSFGFEQLASRSTVGGGELFYEASVHNVIGAGLFADGNVTTSLKGDIASGPLLDTPTLYAPLARAIGPGDTITSQFSYFLSAPTERHFNFTANSGVFSLKFISSVPEPDSWALLILGFGFCGTVMRRETRKTGRPGPRY